MRRAYLGVSTSERPGGGALLRAVVPGGPADDAGLRDGDVIVRVAETRVDRPEDITEAVLERKPGDTVRVEVERDGDRRTLEVRLGERPAQAP